jgi:hypothetical protein
LKTFGRGSISTPERPFRGDKDVVCYSVLKFSAYQGLLRAIQKKGKTKKTKTRSYDSVAAISFLDDAVLHSVCRQAGNTKL